MARENASCLWHDVICLQDAQTITFVCKTLLQLSEESKKRDLLSAEAVEIGSGEMILQVVLEDEENEKAELEMKLPFIKGEIQPSQVHDFQIHYLQGQLLGDKLWVECVISGMRVNEISVPQVILGEITLNEKLRLPEEVAACSRLISIHVTSKVEEVNTNEEENLVLQGMHNISLLYEGVAVEGEKLYVYQEDCPFQKEVELSYTLEDLTAAMLHYRMLTAQQLTERELNIEGVGVVRTVEVLEAENKDEKALEEVELENEGGNRGKQRVSSRNNLAKYMRELDSIVNEEKTLRNFDLQDK